MNKIFNCIISICLIIMMALILPIISFADENEKFDMIAYVENNNISTKEEFDEMLLAYTNSIPEVNIGDLISFSVEIDYENCLVITTTVCELQSMRGSVTGSASKNYYSQNGNKIFEVTVEGTFSYGNTYCNPISVSGQFIPVLLSLWSSTPGCSMGNMSYSTAYCRTSGTATRLNQSVYYSVTLTCDHTGSLGGD